MDQKQAAFYAAIQVILIDGTAPNLSLAATFRAT